MDDCKSEDTDTDLAMFSHQDASDQSQHFLHPEQQQQLLPNSGIVIHSHINHVHLQNTLITTTGVQHQRLIHEPQAMMFAHPSNTRLTPPGTSIIHGNVNCSPNAAVLPFLSLEPPLSEDDYNFALDASEGIVDLFEDDLNPY